MKYSELNSVFADLKAQSAHVQEFVIHIPLHMVEITLVHSQVIKSLLENEHTFLKLLHGSGDHVIGQSLCAKEVEKHLDLRQKT